MLAIAVEVTMILTLVGVSYGTLDGTAERARGVGADSLVRPPGSSVIGLSSAPMSDKMLSVQFWPTRARAWRKMAPLDLLKAQAG